MIPLSLWRTHLSSAAPHHSLPDGTPLNLTASGVDFIERLTGHLLWPENFREACIHLWAASRTPAELDVLWEALPPTNEDPAIVPALHEDLLHTRVRQWQDATIPAAAAPYVRALALRVWNWNHETAIEVDESAIEQPDTEKKSPLAAPTGSSAPSMPSAEATLPDGPLSFTLSPIAASSPPMEHGSPPTPSPSSPPPPAPAETPSSPPSSDPSERIVWVAEPSAFLGNYATDLPSPGGMIHLTKDIHKALQFPTKEKCQEWIDSRPIRDWHPHEHMIG